MLIRALSREAFDSFTPLREDGAEVVATELEWFADDGGNVLGVVSYDLGYRDYVCIVLGRGESGQFTRVGLAHGFKELDEARTQLLAVMTQCVSTGQALFPQDSSNRPANPTPKGPYPFVKSESS